jgi:hypothetical protein
MRAAPSQVIHHVGNGRTCFSDGHAQRSFIHTQHVTPAVKTSGIIDVDVPFCVPAGFAIRLVHFGPSLGQRSAPTLGSPQVANKTRVSRHLSAFGSGEWACPPTPREIAHENPADFPGRLLLLAIWQRNALGTIQDGQVRLADQNESVQVEVERRFQTGR